MRRLALVCGLVALLLACGTVEGPGALGPSPSAIASKLPQPIAQPITRKDPGAQVAWVWTYAGEKRSLVAVDPAGAILAQPTTSRSPPHAPSGARRTAPR